MKIKCSVMTVVAGLALAAVVPAQAQVLGGTLGGAGNVVLGGGGMAGDASAGGALNSDLRDRVQATREHTQSTAEAATDSGRKAAARARTSAASGVEKTREGAKSAAQSSPAASGSAASSTAVEKHAAKRTVKADSGTAADFSADRSGVILGGSQAANASMTRDEPASPEPAASRPETARE